jgi:hypothetical protein
VCIGSPCFDREFSEKALGNLPEEYDDGSDLWADEFSQYHSPSWWSDLLEATGSLVVEEVREIEDGVIYWEDDVLHNLEMGKSVEDELRDAAQARFRGEGFPYLTHFVLSARKKT